MIRFIHTSDWQLGLKLAYVPTASRQRALEERYNVLERIAALAREHAVDAVVVAGDVFDDNAVGLDVIQRARDALTKFGDVPVLLLPGNHDPATPESALVRLGDAPHRHVLDEAVPFREIDGVVFYPCPARSHEPHDDPTAWVPAEADGERVRVAIAHGAAIDFSEVGEGPRLIDTGRLLEKGVDYIALGDWHGVLSLGPRVWYSGAPEATRFKEKQPGYALLVEIAGPGETPVVTHLPVARTRWEKKALSLQNPEDLDALAAWLAGLEEPSFTLVELELEGALSLTDLNRLDRLLEEESQKLLWLKIRSNRVTAAPTAEDLERLDADGFVGVAAERLRGAVEDRGDEDPRAAQDALRLLFRFLTEEVSS